MTTKRIAIAGFIVVAVVVILWISQPDPSQIAGPRGGSSAVQPQQDHFELARNCLLRLDEFDPRQGMIQTAYHLNRWIGSEAQDISWREDPMIEGLPADLRGIPPMQTLAKREFTTSEVRYLQQASWARSITQWLVQQDELSRFDNWLGELEQDLGEPHAYDVRVAAALFDWTVRNVQLDELLPYPGEDADTESDEASSPSIGPLLTATRGPGYTRYPWQTMLFGRGDAWQRTRVFTLLCRQQQIDVVVLAFADGQAQPRPWLPAALIDEQMYLFDPALGLPIPGPDGMGIATLAQVLADKELLRALSMGSAYPYEPADADFDRLVALIDASYESLTYRMRAVTERASEGEPLFLSVDPTQLADRVRRISKISDVRLWRVPLEAWIYRTAFERQAEQDPEIAAQLMFERWLCDEQHPMIQGRVQYFRGNFEKTDDNPGAKSYFIKAIVPASVIAQIGTSPEVQQELGIIRRRENDQQWQLTLQMYATSILGVKQAATYWLGITHYDTGRYETAIPWLKKRTLDTPEGNPWKSGARYNLSRTEEALGNFEAARQLLLLDDSPQKHGNLLRARYLRRRMESQAGTETGEQ
jgi:tetratricopeptide (TPR) repeat protein